MSENAKPKFELKVGRYYRTRDGREVGPVSRVDGQSHPFICAGDRAQFYYTRDGRLFSGGEASVHDLVAELPAPPEAAREALSALQAPSAPAGTGGWKLLPVEPTEAMRQAGIAALDADQKGHNSGCLPGEVYAAMLEAAPAPDAEKDEIARLIAERDRARHYRKLYAGALTETEEVLAKAEARATELEGQVAALVEGLRKAEYALRKDSLCDAERVSSARSTITELLARIQPALNGHSNDAGRE